MRRFALAVTIIAFVGTSAVQAEDKPDPTGTWTWTAPDQNREVTLKLKLEGDKLTGAIVGRNNQETAVEDASFKDSTVTFSVTRERDGQKRTVKYSGKLDGDAIKGKFEFERNGEKQSRDWEAKRSK